MRSVIAGSRAAFVVETTVVQQGLAALWNGCTAA